MQIFGAASSVISETMEGSMSCKICNGQAVDFARATILKKYEIGYTRCSKCGFIQTEKPYWLPEVYAEAINLSDVGLITRNIQLSRMTKALICALFDHNGTFLDYGGGYGMFVRMMRDLGLDYYRYDRYCNNLFAKGFDVSEEEERRFTLVTAFELFEHIEDPVPMFERLLQYSANIFFTTELVPKSAPRPDQWWYYCLDHGQHISFYTLDSLQLLAERFSLNLYSNGSYHLMTKRKLSPFLYRLLCRGEVVSLLNWLYTKKSLLDEDYKRITGMEIK
jgi:methyltransferase family protein